MIAEILVDSARFETWRAKARMLLASCIPPEEADWSNGASLFSSPPSDPMPRPTVTVSPAFLGLARLVVHHRDPSAPALLYRLLWRLQSDRALLQDPADANVAALEKFAKTIRREIHKTHAFVRFRELMTEGETRYLAWFEPAHPILPLAADFFVRRFPAMAWSIFTPDDSAHWDGEILSLGPGGSRAQIPSEDAGDEAWRTYYRSVFNPARLCVNAMTREMPKRYWGNLPEAQAIPSLVREAKAAEQDMLTAKSRPAAKRPGKAHQTIVAPCATGLPDPDGEPERPPNLAALREAINACRRCPLWKDATQGVPGEGDRTRPLLALVGEQPGDQEDLAGKPFVGPAGKILNAALEEAGVDRKSVYVTNAVRHFKHELRGKRRLHKRPDQAEVEVCRWWLTTELELVKPRLLVAMGATAYFSLTGRKDAIKAARDMQMVSREGLPVRTTVHPSYLLRMPDREAAEAERARFVADLAAAWKAASELPAAD